MTRHHRLVATAVLFAALLLGGRSAYAQACQPGISAAWTAHGASYLELYMAVGPDAASLMNELAAVADQPTYQVLLTHARVVATHPTLVAGRVVIALPDGTVVLDTSRADNTANPNSNSYQHFLDKTINENHNSRMAFFLAQEYPCGAAIETKTSSTTGVVENYFALRLGNHFDSVGTVRISQRP